MKFSGSFWFTLGVGVFVILGAGLGLSYAQEGREQAELRGKVSAANERLKNTSARPAQGGLVDGNKQKEIESQLASSRAQLDQARARLRQPLESIEAAARVYRVAAETGVTITSLGTPGPADRKLKGATFATMPLTVTAEGAVPNLVTFVARLSGEFPLGMLETAELIVPAAGGESEPPPAGQRKTAGPALTVLLRIYSYGE